ncbi:uncharacterized protein FFB20_07330 [Fusarium fujikuroi]|uniref:Uncharacterized protein n=2 Tax=Fusarium fujikuroi species complex TaxID=171627 RepID=A0A8H5YQ27_9HYPO|nr:uncharacterized protein FFUJ_03445 [Fusarium fujikuroi IMI 58289]KAF5715621.1 hypothetical protein FGLOB1_2980 [Fusarium globosum]KAI1021438.1 hypothetical protein LB505_000352 [Fusarium chuoi]KLP04504.1 uncharacterized protein LW94_4683 [Fusarium fujikuroi]QGI79777.1 hypothetical protein CEK25_006506 [Fusarium fujikuroi]QGI93507.1 hypothetical protein CEK26_006576 [Fusarium fujikuroi]
MCTTNIYTYVHPDGRREQWSQPTLCANSRHGQVCASNFLFEHPVQYVPAPYDASSYPYATQLPPTPQYSPAPSTPSGSYRSGDESDRSYTSNGSKKKRSSGVYINGQKVLDLNRRERRPSSSRHQERIVLVDSPPTPRTPPQQWNAPHTAPASPISNTYIVDSSRDPNKRRPVIVDERTLQPDQRRVQIEVVDNHHRSKHHRHSSSGSRHSDQEEERRQRRREEKRREEAELRLRTRIAEANAKIASRPVAPAPAPPKRSATYKRPSVEVVDSQAVLADELRRLSFEEERREDKARRLARREEKKEEEAQRERLRERMQPKRRLTIGAGSRRPSEMYEPGVYRYE